MNEFGHKLSGRAQAAIYLSLIWGLIIVLVAAIVLSNWSDAQNVCHGITVTTR